MPPTTRTATAMLTIVGAVWVLSCSQESPVASTPAGKARSDDCPLCDFLGDENYTIADGQGGHTSPDSTDQTPPDSTASETPAESPEETPDTDGEQADASAEPSSATETGWPMAGTITKLTDIGKARAYSPAWSPDGTQIAFTYTHVSGSLRLHSDVYVMYVDGSNLRRLTHSGHDDYEPAWSPDGTQIVFTSDRDGGDAIYVMDAEDGGNKRRIYGGGMPEWSPDGAQIAFWNYYLYNYEVGVIDTSGTNVRWLAPSPHWDGEPAWSPDGTQMAFISQRDGGPSDLYVMDLDGQTVRRLTYGDGWTYAPAWSPDGRYIAFHGLRGDDQSDLYVISADGQRTQKLIEHPSDDAAPTWSPDGTKLAFCSTREKDHYIAGLPHMAIYVVELQYE